MLCKVSILQSREIVYLSIQFSGIQLRTTFTGILKFVSPPNFHSSVQPLITPSEHLNKHTSITFSTGRCFHLPTDAVCVFVVCYLCTRPWLSNAQHVLARCEQTTDCHGLTCLYMEQNKFLENFTRFSWGRVTVSGMSPRNVFPFQNKNNYLVS